MLSILSLNTWQERGPWKERWKMIFTGIKRAKPDIVSFQEVFNADWTGEIKKETGYSNSAFGPVASGLFVISKFPIKSQEVLTYSTKSPNEDYLRYCLWTEMDVYGRPLSLFNTHLSWKVSEGPIRAAQINELADFINKKCPKGESAVTGDFNAPPETEEIKAFIAAGFRDSFEEVNPGSKKITWDNRNPYAAGASHSLPDRRIDYVFYRHPGSLLKVVQNSRIILNTPNGNGTYASDHYGVLTTFN